MNKFIIPILLLSALFAQNIELSFQNIDQDSGYLEIHYNSAEDISGFQMNLTGVSIESVATDLSFIEFSASSGFVLGYLGGAYLPASENGVLFSAYFTPQEATTACLDNIIIAGPGGVNLTVDNTPCQEIDAAYTDCSGTYGGDDLPQEKFDCNGDCCTAENQSSECNLWEDDYLIDCNGVCDGDAYLDTCDVCSGGDTEHEENSDMDCNGVCFGSAYIDDCGFCNSGAASCPTAIDVADDQGYQVYITFQPSQFDDDSLRLSEGYSIERLDDGVWSSLNSFYAYGSDSYQTVAATLINSIEDDYGDITEENLTTFRIIAAMDEGNFATEPFTAQSIDNIHPQTPDIDEESSSIVDNHLSLVWSDVSDADLAYYSVYLEESIEPIGFSAESSTEINDIDDCYYSDYQIGVSSTDLNQNSSEISSAEIDHRAQDYTIDLHYGANLVSFYALPDDVSVGSMMAPLGDMVEAVIGEGVAATPNPVLGWVGSLQEIQPGAGYWIKVNEACQLTVSDATYIGGDAFEYDLHFGANLVSFPSPGEIGLEAALPDDFELLINGIVGEGVAASPNPVLGWVGSLTEFSGTKGYWIKLDSAGTMSYEICDE